MTKCGELVSERWFDISFSPSWANLVKKVVDKGLNRGAEWSPSGPHSPVGDPPIHAEGGGRVCGFVPEIAPATENMFQLDEQPKSHVKENATNEHNTKLDLGMQAPRTTSTAY